MSDKDKHSKHAIAVVGAGNIGSAMARGLGRAGARVNLYNRGRARLEAFGEAPGVQLLTTDMAKALDDAAVVVICVEGDAVEPVIRQMGKIIAKTRPVVVSCAAAPTLEQLCGWIRPFDSKPRVMRLLPNIAATVGKSVNLVCSSGLSEIEEQTVCGLFSATGKSYVVPEHLFGAAMAISSCGIANVLRYVRAAMVGGVELGLNPALAKDLAAGSLAGTAELLDATAAHPEALVDTVTTPGGLTIRGINAMEANGFTAAVIAGIKAATRR